MPIKIILDIYENYLLQDPLGFRNNQDIILFLQISEFFYKKITSEIDTYEMIMEIKIKKVNINIIKILQKQYLIL